MTSNYSLLQPLLLLLDQFIKHFVLLLIHSVVSDSLPPNGLQYARPLCSSLCPRVCSNSCPLSQRYHPTISSSVAPFSSCPLSVYSVLGIGLIVISISTTTLGGTIISPFYWRATEAEKGWESSPRQDLAEELWSGLSCPPAGNLPNLGTESMSLMSHALTGEFVTSIAIRKVPWCRNILLNKCGYVYIFLMHISHLVILLMTYYLLFILHLF